MELERLQQHWTAFGEQDPLWAILAFPDKRRGAWDLEEFFATGRADVDDVLRMLADHGTAVELGRALDFGCGVGRLTRALAQHFASCDGVDLAASMIARARELNENGDRVRFHHNDAPDLRLFEDGSFDFILSLIVLQHMKPELMRGYIREFVRVLRPGGVAVFNVPESFVIPDVATLPPEAWRASLTLIGTVPPLNPGRVAQLRVRVRNDSPVPWPDSADLRVGNHWRAPDGSSVLFDDARTVIGSAVNPGTECEVQLDVFAPVEPGEYELEVDLVQEGVNWFADRGSSTVRLPVTVAARPDAPVNEEAPAVQRQTTQSGLSGFTPQMEMYTMAREDVATTVEGAGGLVLDVIAKDQCGPSFPNLVYVVTRAVAPRPSRSQSERLDPRTVIEARIRGALEDSGHGLRAPSTRLLAADPQRSAHHAHALRLMDERADLVGFGLTSALKGVGRASTALRYALRRAMFQVLHRQTEHNRASDELVRSHEAQLEALAATVRAQLDIQAATDERLDALERTLARVEVKSVALARRAAVGAGRPGSTDLDYLGFTERLGGTTEEVRERLRRYVPRFEGLSDVIDAGCGRGEFLELLREAGVSAVGVDSDDAMAARCRELGLEAIQDDVLRFLQGRPGESQGGIFAAHLVEHLERTEIIELVRLAFRTLRPGGVLVIETVNPACLLTYTTFYDDLTRVGPLPAPALKWLAEASGFEPAEIEYTSPVPPEHKLRPLPASAGDEAEVEAFNRGLAEANELLFGFQEYALVATKPG